VAIVLGTDAIKGEFSNRSAVESFGGPDGRTLADIRRYALSAFQTPGQDHRFIVAPCLRLNDGTGGDRVLYAVYAVNADAVPDWIGHGHIAGIDAQLDDSRIILNADKADVFTHMSDAQRAVTARNNATLNDQREQLRRRAHRASGGMPGGGGISVEWNNEMLSERYKDLEAAPAPVRLTARALTRRLLNITAPA
jgi:hypothetical protein